MRTDLIVGKQYIICDPRYINIISGSNPVVFTRDCSEEGEEHRQAPLR